MCATRCESGVVGRRDGNKSVSAGLREEGTKEVYNGEVEPDASRRHADKKSCSAKGEARPQRMPGELGEQTKGQSPSVGHRPAARRVARRAGKLAENIRSWAAFRL